MKIVFIIQADLAEIIEYYSRDITVIASMNVKNVTNRSLGINWFLQYQFNL